MSRKKRSKAFPAIAGAKRQLKADEATDLSRFLTSRKSMTRFFFFLGALHNNFNSNIVKLRGPCHSLDACEKGAGKAIEEHCAACLGVG